MKTETQIAQEKLKSFKKSFNAISHFHLKSECKSHKATCQRFLEFLEDYPIDNVIENKITDLKQAIKLYNEAGI